MTKRRRLQETATGIVHTYMKTHRGNNHLIRFHTKIRVAWSEIYNIHIHTSAICETHHKIIIHRNNDVYIFDILHMIQNPHLHVGPSHLTIKSFTSDKTGGIFYTLQMVIPDLRTLIRETVYSKTNRIYFWLN